MNVLQAALLGLVQGLGEFLPISSSGHLLFFELLMGFDREQPIYLLLDILLHVGTLIPIVIVFWRDWWGMLRHPVVNRNMWGMLIVASIPALVVHLLGLDDGFETGWFLGASFALTGVLLLVTELLSERRPGGKTKPGYGNALIMGCMQSVALLPGVSRSGSTIAGGILSGMDRPAAAKFSFMMSAPAIAGSLLLEGKDALENGLFASFELLPVLVGVAVAALSGYLAIRFMLRLISRVSLSWFALYVAVLGVAYLLMQLLGVPGIPAFALPARGAALMQLLA